MEYIEQLIGMELGLPARFLAAFIIVMVLIALTAAVIRGFSGSRIADGGGGRGRANRRQRLSVGEWINIDDKRRLVLVRRDDVEHLLLIGGNADLVVERDTGNLKPAAIATLPAAAVQPDVLEPPEEPKAPAIDIPYRSPLRVERPALAATGENAPRVEPAVSPAPTRPTAALGEMGARLQRELERPKAPRKPAADNNGNAESESEASQALAEALDLEETEAAPRNGRKPAKAAQDDSLADALAKELGAGD